MVTSRSIAIALAIILTVLAVSVACVVAAWLLSSGGLRATPTPLAVAPMARVTRAVRTTPTSTPSLTTVPTLSPSLPTPTRLATHTPTATSVSTSTPIPTPVPTPTHTATSDPPHTVTPTPTPVTLVDPSLASSTSLADELIAMPAGQRVVLHLYDDHLTRELAAYLATQPQAIYRNARVRFSPGQVELGGEIRVLGFWVPATVWGHLQAQDCRVQASITDLSAGGLFTPAFLREEAAKLIQGELDKALNVLFTALPLCLESVEIGDGAAIVQGIKR
ncbi:MAG: hypothetical protein JSV36_06150 [Anaerolineae bacterium]|nr:MAG: hypothetical protein JSV36_06150 [Anaerolineae bacterium]